MLVTNVLNDSVKSAIGILTTLVAAVIVAAIKDILPTAITLALAILMFVGLFVLIYHSLPNVVDSIQEKTAA